MSDITIGELLRLTERPIIPDGLVRWLPDRDLYNSKEEYQKVLNEEEIKWQEFIKPFNGLIN